MLFLVFHLDKGADLEPYITLQDTRFRQAIPSRVRLLTFLHHVMLGASYVVVSPQYGIAPSTVSKCVHQVTSAILQHMWSAYIRLPTVEQGLRSMTAWELQTHIPGIIGAVDGTHIQIRRPSKDGERYFNQKGFYSLNVQGIFLLVATVM